MIKNELDGTDIVEAYFVYDGDCAVCQGTFDYFVRLELPTVLRGVKYQFEEELLQKYGLTPALCDRHAYTIANPIMNTNVQGCDCFCSDEVAGNRVWHTRTRCVFSADKPTCEIVLEFLQDRGHVSKLFTVTAASFSCIRI